MDNNVVNLFNTKASANVSTQAMSDLIDAIREIPDEELEKIGLDTFKTALNEQISNEVRQEAINTIIANFTQNRLTFTQAYDGIAEIKAEMRTMDEGLEFSEYKSALFDTICQIFDDIFDEALEQIKYKVTIKMKVEDGIQLPRYAHNTDACMDLCAAETIKIPAYSFGTKIKTGIRMEIPEGWCVKIVPRSSTGAKTPLRLSNCIGVIDSSYRGEIMLLFDNLSNSAFTINAGDRLAQMWAEPVQYIKIEQVNELSETERGEGGFGSTGK